MADELIGRSGSSSQDVKIIKTGTLDVEKSTNFDIVDGDGIRSVLMDTSIAQYTSKLPVLANSLGRELTFCKKGANNYTIDGDGATINGSSTVTISSDTSSLTVKAYSTEWRIV